MRRPILLTLSILIFYACSSTPVDYFPEGTFDDFTINWYSEQLDALDELPIHGQKSNVTKRIYRFIWLRSFHHPISLRIEISDKDRAVLYIKETDGAGGYEPGKIKTKDEKGLSKVEVGKFLETIAKNNFWSLAKTGGGDGLDGAQWIIEGVSDGKYHVVERWSPDEGNVREIGLCFLKMSGLNVNDDEIY
jgi:hypothetical protein